MSPLLRRRGDASALAAERKRVLEALHHEELTGPALFRRLGEKSPSIAAPGDQSLLYPALHGESIHAADL